MNKKAHIFFAKSVIDDTVIGLPDNDFIELGKCYLCGRKLHFRNALVVDDYDGISFAGKRCSCCGAVYLTKRSIQLLLTACHPDNLKLNYKKEVRYERFTPTKRFEEFIKREDVIFIMGDHNCNIIKNDESRKNNNSYNKSNKIPEFKAGSKDNDNVDVLNSELEETVEW